MKIFFTITILSLCVGCTNYEPIRTYGFMHKETSVITGYIIYDEKEIPIKLSNRSDRQALDSFSALKWNIVLANSDGKTIYITGELGKDKKYTTSDSGHTSRSSYYDFKIIEWYIKPPFKRLDWKGGIPAPGDNMLTEQTMHLNTDDFDEFPGKSNIDLITFERKPHNKTFKSEPQSGAP